MTRREQDSILNALTRAKDAVERARQALDGFVENDADEALAALGRIQGVVEEAR
jgi:phage shock protein A